VTTGGRDTNTRQRVLNVAAQLFSDRGFRKVTVREICRRARANVAAVNYHFHDKAGLYREVVEMAVAVMEETNDAARRAAEAAPRDGRLRAHVRVYVDALASGRGPAWMHRLITREQADPTFALDVFVNRAIRPRLEYLTALVREVAGPSPSDELVMTCVFSLQAQSLMMALPNPISERLRGAVAWTPEKISALADHITDFTLGGIAAVSRRSTRGRS
jgi:TetR/AcrR family transcriptional regulator, regulator of cefoperazone and chloramphenicol sensitivity